jgi:hypothetical protein
MREELTREFSRMNGILFGKNGRGGAIVKIEESLVKIDTKIDGLQKTQNEQNSKLSTEIAILKERLEDAEGDIDSVAEKVRCVETDVYGKSKRVIQRITDMLIPIVGGGIVTLIVLGIREFIRQAG